jgi:hypothetical protein
MPKGQGILHRLSRIGLACYGPLRPVDGVAGWLRGGGLQIVNAPKPTEQMECQFAASTAAEQSRQTSVLPTDLKIGRSQKRFV